MYFLATFILATAAAVENLPAAQSQNAGACGVASELLRIRQAIQSPELPNGKTLLESYVKVAKQFSLKDIRTGVVLFKRLSRPRQDEPIPHVQSSSEDLLVPLLPLLFDRRAYDESLNWQPLEKQGGTLVLPRRIILQMKLELKGSAALPDMTGSLPDFLRSFDYWRVSVPRRDLSHLSFRLLHTFHVDGQLWRLPVLASPDAFVVALCNGRDVRVLRQLTELAGHVRIRTRSEALNYVRLRTSLGLTTENNEEHEIVKGSSVDLGFTFGCRDILEWLRDRGEERGLVQGNWFKTHQLSPTSIQTTEAGWLIRRPVLVWDLVMSPPKTLVLEEPVGRRGGYNARFL